jgi:hypothetical protein
MDALVERPDHLTCEGSLGFSHLPTVLGRLKAAFGAAAARRSLRSLRELREP